MTAREAVLRPSHGLALGFIALWCVLVPMITAANLPGPCHFRGTRRAAPVKSPPSSLSSQTPVSLRSLHVPTAVRSNSVAH